MKHLVPKSLKAYLFLIFSVFITHVVFAQNLLTNGDFEQNFSSWTNLSSSGASSVYSISTADVASGTKAMKLEISQLGTVSYAVQSIHAGWTATQGKLYTISFFAKSLQNGSSLDVLHQNAGFTKKSFLLNSSWQQFEYTYTADSNDPGFKFQFPSKATYLIDAIIITEFNPSNIVIPSASSRPLRELAARCNLNIGSVGDQSTDANYTNTLKREYNIVVNENAMKMGSIKSTEAGAYNFTGPDNLLAFAQSNGMKMRGHCILWHEGMPDWVKNKAWTKQTLLSYLKTYITTVVGRYKGKIEEWDVANEFIGGNNDLRNGTESVWMKYIGEEVLDSAFKWVHQIDPNAKLYYNDYGAEAMNAKSNAVYELVKRLKNRGVPINGLGMQCHFSYDQIISINSTFSKEMDQNIKRIGTLGLQVSFTETDLAMPLPGDDTKYKIQALSYGNLLKIALNNPTIVKSFLSWGFTDKHSWIPNFKPGFGDALSFNQTYQPKYAYNQMSNLLELNCPLAEPKGPYSGTPITIAGTIEAENYNKGGEGISFHDTEAANMGATYRTDGVDIGTLTGGGNFVGWTATGEWMEYSVNVTKTSSYDFKFLTASLGGGGVLSLTVDGNPLLTNITVPSTGDWNTYTPFSKTATLNQGNHVIRLLINNFGFNIDKIVVSETATCTASISSPTNAFCAGGSVVLSASAGVSYKWLNGTTQVGTAANYTATVAGSYTVEVTNASGCKSTSAVKVIAVNPLPVITHNVNANGNWTAASTATACAATNVILGPWPIVETGWSWTGPNNFTATTREIYLNNSQVNQSGIYTATYTDANGCNASSTFNLKVNAATIWYADTDNDGKGDPATTVSSCAKPTGYVAIAGDACPTDANKIAPGNCGCNKTEGSCLDCAGVANGTAIIDACNKCAGGTTGIAIVTDPGKCVTTNITTINGPLCVSTGTSNAYSLSTNLSVASINWWSNSGASITKDPANPKNMQINFPSYANGTNATLTAGVNLNAAPWYQEFTLLVKVGGCTGSSPQLRAAASPLPFNTSTTIMLENDEVIHSIKIVDMNGIEVFNADNINTTAFELGNNFNTGLYIAYVTSNKGTSIIKLVKSY